MGIDCHPAGPSAGIASSGTVAALEATKALKALFDPVQTSAVVDSTTRETNFVVGSVSEAGIKDSRSPSIDELGAVHSITTGVRRAVNDVRRSVDYDFDTSGRTAAHAFVRSVGRDLASTPNTPGPKRKTSVLRAVRKAGADFKKAVTKVSDSLKKTLGGNRIGGNRPTGGQGEAQ